MRTRCGAQARRGRKFPAWCGTSVRMDGIRKALHSEVETLASDTLAYADTVRSTSPARPEISRMVWYKRSFLLVALALLSIAVLVWGIRKLPPSDALPGEKRIAVLPFTVVGNDAE